MAFTGHVLPHSAAEAASSSAALSVVADAIMEHGLVVLPAPAASGEGNKGQSLLPPAELISLVRQLSMATGGKGELMPVISDIESACPPTNPPHCALILTNIRHGTPAAAAVGPRYQGSASLNGYIGSPPGRAAVWHQDEQFRARPAHLTALYCVRTPADGLADTTFADSARGYTRLLPAVQEHIARLHGRHSLANIPLLDGGDPRSRPDHSVATHPLVLDPPRGKRCIYLGSIGADVIDSDGNALGSAQAKALLHALFASIEESGVYTHRWRVGECLIMDNRRVLHTASGRDYSHDERLMVRVQSREPLPYEAIRAKM
jgi:alpha-ketoglutarate-dependent taurine dioxygenase